MKHLYRLCFTIYRQSRYINYWLLSALHCVSFSNVYSIQCEVWNSCVNSFMLITHSYVNNSVKLSTISTMIEDAACRLPQRWSIRYYELAPFNGRVTNFPPITGRTFRAYNAVSAREQIVAERSHAKRHISTLCLFTSCGDILHHCQYSHLFRPRFIRRPDPCVATYALPYHYYISPCLLFCQTLPSHAWPLMNGPIQYIDAARMHANIIDNNS